MNKWVIFGWSAMLKKLTVLAYGKTKREMTDLLRKWRNDGFQAHATVRKRERGE